MICPNCNVGVKFEPSHIGPVHSYNSGHQTGFDISEGNCPECSRFLVVMRKGRYYQQNSFDDDTRELTPDSLEVIFPVTQNQRPVPLEVPDEYKNDFTEAVGVLPISAKASAAISRRLLQHILREQFKIQHRSLEQEILTFIALPGIPSHLVETIDAVRNIGNLAAHPTKDTNTGEVMDVEPGEAEWLIEVLESLFDFTFVQPFRLIARKNALNTKLQSAGKKPMK